MADTIIEAQGLTKAFSGFVAVQDVNLKVRRGSIHALIGPNGAGKTTLFNLITKFLPHLTVLENVRVALQRRLGVTFHFWRSPSCTAS